jgi:hypothetical protein
MILDLRTSDIVGDPELRFDSASGHVGAEHRGWLPRDLMAVQFRILMIKECVRANNVLRYLSNITIKTKLKKGSQDRRLEELLAKSIINASAEASMEANREVL